MRRRRAGKRQINPDVIYNSELISMLVNRVMQRGKKAKAQAIVYTALDIIQTKLKEDNPLEIYLKAIENTKPLLELKSRRIGGANYQIPIEVNRSRQIGMALRWFVTFAQKRKGIAMSEALADEIINAYNNTGASIKKRDDTHKMARANRAFAHYRW